MPIRPDDAPDLTGIMLDVQVRLSQGADAATYEYRYFHGDVGDPGLRAWVGQLCPQGPQHHDAGVRERVVIFREGKATGFYDIGHGFQARTPHLATFATPQAVDLNLLFQPQMRPETQRMHPNMRQAVSGDMVLGTGLIVYGKSRPESGWPGDLNWPPKGACDHGP